MTGYGRGEHEENGIRATVEIRSVNHRFLEIAVRLPRTYMGFEERIKKKIQENVARGRLDVYVTIDDNRENKRKIKLDKELAVEYYNYLRELAKILEIDFQLRVIDIVQLPDVIIAEEEEKDLEEIWSVVEKALEQAVAHLVQMRTQEGANLYKDFLHRKKQVRQLLQQIKERAPLLSEELREKLRSRVEALVGEEIEEERLLTEVVFYAERSDITEEVVRLFSHLDQFSKLLEASGPVGRKLDFLLQEMNREINTIGAKAADLVISPLVVEIKSELEKMREQVQNVE
ncbi:MAG: Uncharacterized protein XD63_1010 [Thermoanaerobacterales bacterium 50_218]|nr:MAG: Uncharacterized protein XD63_1010 [Thermoanaerobacterales bacterium 50_218]